MRPPAGLIMWEVFCVLIIALLIIALFDLLKSSFKDNTIKLIWLIVILFVPIIGLILYFAIGRKQKA